MQYRIQYHHFMALTRRIAFSFVMIISAISLSAEERTASFPSSNSLVKQGTKPDRKQGYEFRIVKVSVSSDETAVSCELFFEKKVK